VTNGVKISLANGAL